MPSLIELITPADLDLSAMTDVAPGRWWHPSRDLESDRLPLLVLTANQRATTRAQAQRLISHHIDLHGPDSTQIITDAPEEWAEAFIEHTDAPTVIDLIDLAASANPFTVEAIVNSQVQEGAPLIIFDMDAHGVADPLAHDGAAHLRQVVLRRVRSRGKAAVCVTGSDAETPESHRALLDRASLVVDHSARIGGRAGRSRLVRLHGQVSAPCARPANAVRSPPPPGRGMNPHSCITGVDLLH